MTNDKKLITKKGYRKLEKELEKREGVLRKEIADRLDEAASLGDRSENSAYIQALEDYQYNETRIRELKDKLDKLEIAPDKKGDCCVDIGDEVVLKDAEGKEDTYTIVGAGEGDPSENLISSDSKVGSRILGKKAGDLISIDLPKGKEEYTVVEVK